MSLYEILVSPFVDYAFMRRALAGCAALSLGAAPIGVLMMLRRMSLVGDAMAHGILPGTAITFLLFGLKVVPMTIGGLMAGLAVALSAGLVARNTIMREDASLAAFYLISLALGVMIISAKGSNVDLMHVLFGTVLALDDSALLVLGFATTINVLGLAVIFRPLVAECVDPSFLSAVSRSGGVAHLSFLLMAVLGLVAGFQALGTLLSVGMMMLPAAGSRFWARSVEGLMATAVVAGIASSVAGLLVSYHLSVASGPAITLAAGAFYLVSLVFGPVSGAIWNVLPQRHRVG